MHCIPSERVCGDLLTIAISRPLVMPWAWGEMPDCQLEKRLDAGGSFPKSRGSLCDGIVHQHMPLNPNGCAKSGKGSEEKRSDW